MWIDVWVTTHDFFFFFCQSVPLAPARKLPDIQEVTVAVG